MSDDVPLVPLGLVSPGVYDDRQTALAQLLDHALSGFEISSFTMNDPMTVDARLLPYLIHEYSAQRFVDLSMPEIVQRRILSRIWELHQLTGFDAGVKLGLSLLGMQATIDQWHQQDPMGAPNTHRITVMIDDVLYPDEGGYFAPRQITAMQNMINASKRWSQDSEIRIGVTGRTPIYAGVYPAMHIKAIARPNFDPPPVAITSNRRAVASTVHVTVTAQAA